MNTKLHPIIFSTAMVTAILDGRKTMTRRIIKIKHLVNNEIGSIHKDGSGKGWIAWSPLPVSAEETANIYPGEEGFKCLYGEPGDILWVRETWQYVDIPGEYTGYVFKIPGGKDWEMSNENWKWKPSIFMPKAACRIFLEVTRVKVERLQDISEDDARLEGVSDFNPYAHERGESIFSPKKSFQSLWEKINGSESWLANPWVWAISFKQTEKPENFIT